MTKKLDPELAKEVMMQAGLNPLEPYKSSSQKWKSVCMKCMKEVQPTFSSVQQGGGCVYCAGKKVDAQDAQALMLEAGLEPLEPYRNSKYKWKSLHISCGEIVYPSYADIKAGFGGCKKCGYVKRANSQRKPEHEAVSDMRHAGLEPLEPYVNSGSRWKCRHKECGRVVYPTYDSVKQGRGGCKPCADTSTGIKKRNSDQSTVKIMLESNLEPLEPYTTSKTPWKCKCLVCGNVVSPTFNGVQSGQGCLFCGRKSTADSKRTPEDQAIQIMLNAKLKPLEPFKGTNYPWKCECLECGKTSLPRLSHIKRGVRCSYCSGSKIDDEDAVQVMLGAGLSPLEPYRNSHATWKAECLKCGAIEKPRYSDVRQGKGCKSCGITRRADTARTPQELAIAVMIKRNAKPLEPYLNNKAPWKCECLKCGQIIYPAYANVNSGSEPCVYCNPAGIKYDKPGYLYILHHQEYLAIKVGISNQDADENRINTFTREGWKVYKTFKMQTGRQAAEVEKETFRWLRKDKGLGVHLSKSEMKRGGWSETVDSNEITLKEIEVYVKKVIKGLRN